MTYDLREDYLAQGYSPEQTAEFDGSDTIDAIEGALQDLDYKTDRIGGIRNLAHRLAAGDRWDLVFNIAEGLRGFGREAQVPALLEAYNVPYTFSDPLVLSLTLHKAMTKHVIRDMGVPTADFFVVEKDSDVEMVNMALPLFAKPIAEGTGKGITRSSKIDSKAQLASVCHQLLRLFNQPVLVETFLPGREFTVGIIGTGEDAKAIGVTEVLLKEGAEPGVYSYLNKEKCEELVEYRMAHDATAAEAAAVALKAWKVLGCRDAGRIDLRVDRDRQPKLLELNPLAGLHPEHSDLCIIARQAGMTYKLLIGTIVSSALKRNSVEKRPKGYDSRKEGNRPCLQ